MSPRMLSIVLVVVTLAAAACGDDDGEATVSSTATVVEAAGPPTTGPGEVSGGDTTQSDEPAADEPGGEDGAGRATLTVKGAQSGLTRAEYEYEIPVADAKQMLEELCERPLIEKVRHVVVVGEGTWEIDEFSGVNAGLIVAEIELDHADQPIELPPWIGTEVTDDPRYFNSNLITHPYKEW